MNPGGVLPGVPSRQAGPSCLQVMMESRAVASVPSPRCVILGRLHRGGVELYQLVQAASGTVLKGLGTLLQGPSTAC